MQKECHRCQSQKHMIWCVSVDGVWVTTELLPNRRGCLGGGGGCLLNYMYLLCTHQDGSVYFSIKISRVIDHINIWMANPDLQSQLQPLMHKSGQIEIYHRYAQCIFYSLTMLARKDEPLELPGVSKFLQDSRITFLARLLLKKYWEMK